MTEEGPYSDCVADEMAVLNFIRDPGNYGKKRSKDLPGMVSPRSEWRIILPRSNWTLIVWQITAKAHFDTKIKNLRNIIARAKWIAEKNDNLPETADPSLIFQPNTAEIQNTKVGKQYFRQKQIEVLVFPIKFRQINMIENCWGHRGR